MTIESPLLKFTGKSRKEVLHHAITGLLLAKDARKIPAILRRATIGISQSLTLHIKGTTTAKPFSITIIPQELTGKKKSIVLQWKGLLSDRPGRSAPKKTVRPVAGSRSLRRTEGLFRSFADTSPGMIWVSDEQDNTIYFNKSWLQFTGITVEDVAGDGWTKLIHPNDIPVAIELYRNHFRKRDPVVLEYRINTKTSGFRWVIDHSLPRYAADGSFLGYIGSVMDIHEQKSHEEFLALEKKVLEMNARPAISLKTITDYFLEGLEHFFPGMLCSVITLREDQVSIEVLSAPSLPSEYSGAISGLRIGPQAGACGTAMYRKERVITTDIDTDPLWDGYRHLTKQFGLRSCWSLPILNAHNEVIATIATYYHQPKMPSPRELDILERVGDLLRIIIENKNAEARIRMNHERYLLVTKATNDAIWDWDVASNLYWGEGFYTLFGYKPGLSPGSYQRWEQCIHPEDRERVINGLNNYIRNNTARVWEAEYRFKKANGEYALVHDRGFLIFDQDGKINRMVGSVQDITEKREMEKKLLEQELNKQKLVAQAVVNAQEKERAEIGKELHDNVNQILTTAKLYLELAKNEESERVELISRSADSISDAINEVRTISRSLVPASVGDLGLIDSIQDLVESVRATRKLRVTFHHTGDIDSVMDEKRKLMLFRIIQEQVNNVLKHAFAASLVIELTAIGRVIDLTITDDGKGFEPATVRAKKGTGIHNIISRAELFNGQVTITTSPGNGCRLNINVPISN